MAKRLIYNQEDLDLFLELENEKLKKLQENQQLKIQISAREENYKKLEVLVECLKLGITLNQEQEELLDKTLFERGVSDDNDC